MSNSIQITAENAEEFLNAALEEEKAQNPKPSEEAPATPETPEEPEAPEDPKLDEKAKLEIPKKEEPKEGEKPKEGEEPAEGATFSMEDISAEYAENGALSEETTNKIVGALEKAGFQNAQGIISQYLAGFDATVSQIRTTAFNAAGGQESYSAMVEWARDNFTPSQIAAYDASVSDPDMVELAVAGLRAKFEAAGGGLKSRRVSPGAKPDGDTAHRVSIPRSQHEVSALVSDPRYSKDPGYRADVDAAIGKAIERGQI